MPLQLNIFLLLFGAIQGLLLSIVIAGRKKQRTEFFFLIVYITVLILQILFKAISKVWLMQNVEISYILSYQLPFLYGPLIYLFIRKMYLPERHFKWIDLTHFIPFLIVVIHLAISDPYKIPPPFVRIFTDAGSRLILQMSSILIYHVIAYRISRGYEKKERGFYSSIPEVRAIWLKQFTLVSFFISAAIAVLLYIMYIKFPVLQPVRFSFILLTFFIYWITWSAMKNPDLLQMISTRTSTMAPNDQVKTIPTFRTFKTPVKYQSSGLCNEDADHMLLKLENVMDKQRLFLDSGLTIDILADKIGCSRHHLSQVLNQKINRSFYDHINFYRVEWAKKLLLDENIQNHKIASIAYDSGFNSLSTFNDVFKKTCGATPSAYRKKENDSRKQRV